MKRITAIAKGEVQRVNYREEVQRIARRLGITGYVENLKPYDVKVVAEGEEDKLKHFIELIKIKRFPIFVEEMEVEWSKAAKEFSYFEIRRGEWQEELIERLDTAGRLLYRSVELSEKSVQLGEKSVQLGEKSVQLGEKSVQLGEKSVQLGEKSVQLGEETLKAIREESEKTRTVLGDKIDSAKDEIAEKIDSVREAVKEESEKTREEIRMLRFDLKEYIETNMKEIHSKISEIERALKKAGIM
jgi:acylphosphatase